MRWLDISVPRPGWVCMRRLDERFHEIAVKQFDYDFGSAGCYAGRELDAALQLVTDMAEGVRNHAHAILPASWGQSVIIGSDEAAELLPNLTRAIDQARSGTHD
ncbi:MAG: hypothetical protein GX875_02790 [Propionibacterium sp.]|nr:hypothetical protein [Propionibacterium sp.]